MLLDEGFASRALLAGRGDRDLARLEVGRERHLGVDRDVLSAGQVDDHVGATGAGIRTDAVLHVEVDALDEAGRLDDVAQLGLAPDAARRVVAQRGRERFGGRAQALLGLCRRLELLRQLAVLLRALCLELGDLQLHVRQRVLDRGEGLQHLALGLLGLLALLRIKPSALDQFAVLLLGGTELIAQCLQRGLRRGQPCFDFGACTGLLVAQLGHDGGVTGLDDPRVGIRSRRRAAGAADEHADDRAERDAEGESEEKSEDRVHAASVPAPGDIPRSPAPHRPIAPRIERQPDINVQEMSAA